MNTGRAVLDRMIADRAARNRRSAFWQERTRQMREHARARGAANDDTTPPARTGS